MFIASSSKYSCSFERVDSLETFSFIYNALVISPAFITSNSSILINSDSLLVFVVALTLTIYSGFLYSIMVYALTVLFKCSSSTIIINL